MKKKKTYYWTKFTPEVIVKGFEVFKKQFSSESPKLVYSHLWVSNGGEEWEHDSEAEFFSDYRKEFDMSFFTRHFAEGDFSVESYLTLPVPRSDVTVALPARSGIESVFAIFEEAAPNCAIPQPEAPPIPPWESRAKVFIGHGGSPIWRDLKDHLSDQQHIETIAYEIGATAGLTIKEVLDEMLTNSSFAILVLTGEVEDTEGKFHARDNVIHELGLFQGRLGFRRAIVLLEEGATEFSNIHGIQQIRFQKGRIRETFGDVLAVLKREFGSGG